MLLYFNTANTAFASWTSGSTMQARVHNAAALERWVTITMQRLAAWSACAARRGVGVGGWGGAQAAVQLQPQFKALLVDAAGTLIYPSEPAAEVTAHLQRHFCMGHADTPAAGSCAVELLAIDFRETTKDPRECFFIYQLCLDSASTAL